MSLDSNLDLPATHDRQGGIAVSERRIINIGSLDLELGGQLDSVDVAFETYGTFDGTNAVLVEHALTGDSRVTSHGSKNESESGWWHEVVGQGKALDTDKWFVVCANVLGGCQGTTGPSSIHPDGRAWGSRFPRITVRDQVAAEYALAKALKIERFHSILGGSMGAMRTLEWIIQHPQSVGSALLLATSAIASADQIGIQATQIAAITNDPYWYGGDYYNQSDGSGPRVGLAIARKIAHLSYRCETELTARFGVQPQTNENPLSPKIVGRDQGAGRFAVQSYLDHHGEKLVARFDAGSYVILTDVMNTHDVSRGRGDLASTLGSISVPVVVGGIDTDRLYPISQQEYLALLIPTCESLSIIDSVHGHDGFLIETQAVSELVRKTLELSSRD